MGCGCGEELVGGQMDDAVVWFDGKYLALSGNTIFLNADLWYDARTRRHFSVLLEFQGSAGNLLTVTLQTAVAPTADDNAWKDVTSATTTMANSAAVLEAPASLTQPVMGVMRLKFAASGAVTGVLRAQVLGKERT